MSDYAQINNNRPATMPNYTAQQRNTGTGGSFNDVLKAQEDKSGQVQPVGQQSENAEDKDYMKQLKEHMEEMLDKIRHGTIQPKIQIGAQEYTQEEWKKLLEKFDEAEEELVEQVEAEIEMRMEKAEQEKAAREAALQEELKAESEKPVDSLIQYML